MASNSRWHSTVYGTSNTRADDPDCTDGETDDSVALGGGRLGVGAVASSPVGVEQAGLSSGQSRCLSGSERVRAVGTHSRRHPRVCTHTPRWWVLSLSVTLEPRARVCVCVCFCDQSITPTVRSAARLPAHHCSLAVFLIDILIGRFECRL